VTSWRPLCSIYLSSHLSSCTNWHGTSHNDSNQSRGNFPLVFCRPRPHPDRRFARCFMVSRLTSRKRSTQLARHFSSPESSLPFLMLLVMHLFQQISVRACVSARTQARRCQLLAAGAWGEGGQRPRNDGDSRDCIRVRCCSLVMNCASSALSFSVRREMSACVAVALDSIVSQRWLLSAGKEA